MRRFSLVATVTLVVVLVTGATRGVLEIGTPANLVHTGYGITLLVKVGLVVVLVASPNASFGPSLPSSSMRRPVGS